MRLLVLSDGKTYTTLEGCKVVVVNDRPVGAEYDDMDAVVEAIFEDEHTADGHVVAKFGPEPERVTWDAIRNALLAIGIKVYMQRSAFGPWAQLEAQDGKRHELTLNRGSDA